MMLIEILRRDSAFAGGAWAGKSGEIIYDMSVGYDLAGIRSDKVQRFLDGMRDASGVIEKLREQIPAECNFARALKYPSRISSTLTLSTFHGCPANEIEKICEFLIGERDLDVIVKMNPPMLGKERLEHLLHDVLGYGELTVNPAAYTSGLLFDESLGLCSRLTSFAEQRGRSFGAKFSNTLEVLNHKSFFPPDNQVQYLSGLPLHVITMALTDLWRQDVGPDVPISFSAGIDAKNFPLAVACGFVPVTTCSDLLKPGGYGRMPAYLTNLTKAMKFANARTIDEYIAGTTPASPTLVRAAAVLNTTIMAEKARQDPRYRADQNRKVPNRIDSHLVILDCITCDKCIPVCPNAANFTYPTPIVAFDYHDLTIDAGVLMPATELKRFAIEKSAQIANYADFCNECGNCDTFCPEYGGPFIEKPSFYGSIESWTKAAPRDGFVVASANGTALIRGRIQGVEYALTWNPAQNTYDFSDRAARVTLSATNTPLSFELSASAPCHQVNMGRYHTLRHLLHGVLDPRCTNQVNVRATV
ncbi:MAG: hypothetical protein H0U59_05195 [Gemmatimonadaceae bacterium]|nr:hypothetical protein [Gemmatimonadaceae bacterium]